MFDAETTARVFDVLTRAISNSLGAAGFVNAHSTDWPAGVKVTGHSWKSGQGGANPLIRTVI